jgi:hypothetical protein
MVVANDLARRVLESHLGHPDEEAAGEANYRCPFCATSGYSYSSHLHVNYYKGTALCHQCGYKTRNLEHLVRDATGESLTQRAAFAGNFQERVYDRLFADSRMAVEKEKVAVSLPEGFRRLVREPGHRLGQVIWNYLVHDRKRAVPPRMIRALGTGYVTSGPMRGYAIFPVHVNGELVTWTSRRVAGTGSKVRHAPGSSSSNGLFLYDFAKSVHPTRLWVVEGPFDAIALHRRFHEREAAVALFGTLLSDPQVRLIGDLGAEEVIVCLDPDAAEKAVQVAEALSRSLDSRVTIASLPDGKDPDELDDSGLAGVLADRVDFDPFAEVLAGLL